MWEGQIIQRRSCFCLLLIFLIDNDFSSSVLHYDTATWIKVTLPNNVFIVTSHHSLYVVDLEIYLYNQD